MGRTLHLNNELGIRAALGATTRSLTALVLRENAVLVGAGLGAGSVTLGTVVTSILLLAIVVSMRPALRAARVHLAEVLRSE